MNKVQRLFAAAAMLGAGVPSIGRVHHAQPSHGIRNARLAPRHALTQESTKPGRVKRYSCSECGRYGKTAHDFANMVCWSLESWRS